jgi:tetratricopeptide (TPR) repeat protein
MTMSSPDPGIENDSAMISKPHLFFAEVSLDLSRGKFQSGLDKLMTYSEYFHDSYLFHLLCANAFKGLKKHALAGEYFRKCCAIAPANQVAWKELFDLQASGEGEEHGTPASVFDPISDELEKLTAALMHFSPVQTTENSDPTSILEQKQPFSDDTAIAVPTESLASLFTAQGAYKKAIKIYTLLIHLKPQNAEHYQNEIDTLLNLL